MQQDKDRQTDVEKKKWIVLMLKIVVGIIGGWVIVTIVYLIIITPSCIGVIRSEDAGSWFAFIGAILGGLLTLLGVRYTVLHQKKLRDAEIEHEEKIRREMYQNEENVRQERFQHEEKMRKETLAIEYKPIIGLTQKKSIGELIRVDCIINVTGYEPSVYIGLNESSKDKLYCIVENMGRGEARGVKFYYEISNGNPDAFGNELYSGIQEPQGNIELVTGQQMRIAIQLPDALIVKSNYYRSLNRATITLKLVIQYTDLYSLHHYETEYRMGVKIGFIGGIIDEKIDLQEHYLSTKVEYDKDYFSLTATKEIE